MAGHSPAISAWESAGEYRPLLGRRIFTLDLAPTGPERHEPLLVLHGFPTSSFDFHLVVDALRRHRRVLALDLLGYGLSDKPDAPYTIELQADIVAAFTHHAGVEELALLTHDMGDTVGGELLARQMEGTWPVEVTRRIVTNGSIYIEMAQLSAGQELLLGLPDQRLPPAPLDAAGMEAALAATFAPGATVDGGELAAMAELISHHDGHLVLPRVIRYIEERRRSQDRFTGAIEAHPSALTVIWGVEDPIAVVAMSERLHQARPDSVLHRLDGVGHYPMIEAPERFAAVVPTALDWRT